MLCQAFCRLRDPLGDSRSWGAVLPKAHSTAVLDLQMEDEKSCSLTFCSNTEDTGLTEDIEALAVAE